MISSHTCSVWSGLIGDMTPIIIDTLWAMWVVVYYLHIDIFADAMNAMVCVDRDKSDCNAKIQRSKTTKMIKFCVIVVLAFQLTATCFDENMENMLTLPNQNFNLTNSQRPTRITYGLT